MPIKPIRQIDGSCSAANADGTAAAPNANALPRRKSLLGSSMFQLFKRDKRDKRDEKDKWDKQEKATREHASLYSL